MSNEGGGANESFSWEDHVWGLSNSDNSVGQIDQKKPSSGKKDQELENGANRNRKTERGEINNKGKSNESGGDDQESKDGKGVGESDHEIHIWTERERRKKMRNMFSNLHALLPQLPPKADKSTIVDEAVNYIKTLEHTLQNLKKQKLEKLQGAMNCTTYGGPPSTTNNIINPPSQIFQNENSCTTPTREAFVADRVSSSTSSDLITAPKLISSSSSVDPMDRNPVLFQTWTSSNVVLNICGDNAQISVCSPKKQGMLSTICYVLEKHNVDVLSAHVSSDSNRSMYMIQAHANVGAGQFTEAMAVDEIFRQVACEIMCWVSS